MPRERFSSLFANEAESEIIPQAELRLAMTETTNLEEQIEQIFEALRMPVYQYLLSVFAEPTEAEDLTQEAFFQLYKTLLKGQEINNVRFWIFRVAHNLAVDKRKHQQFVSALRADNWEEVEKIIPDGSPNPEQIFLEREKFERIFNGLKRLTLNERQCLYLRAEGFRYKEIAEIMKVGVPTVGEYLRRSIKKLGGNGGE
ncbi:MAG: sigma-70 family RNA polymerase sigma factor [Acidobacteriota bacterium]|nr:sigma-70 family RNA polymerase sigma factor [Blastocatellia bacterium]MDW8241065.1 sigma-70 family RNA polymerase sigma factor [Acidobacteriota bacterium]